MPRHASFRGRKPITCLIFAAALGATLHWTDAAFAQFSLSVGSPTNNTTGNLVSDFLNGSAARADGVSNTGAGGSTAASFGATLSGSVRYVGGVAADNGAATTSASTATLNADYNFNFSVSAPNTAVYQVTVGSRMTAGMTAIDDAPDIIFQINSSNGASSISAVTGRLNGTTNGSLGLPGASRGGTSNDNGSDTNVNNTNSLVMGAVQGNGVAASNNLRYTFQLFASSPSNFATGGDEQAVRLGVGNYFSPTFGASVDDYPGVAGRNINNDGHFVTVTAQVVNTKPIASAGGGYVYSAGGLTQTFNGAGSVTGQAGNEGGQALSYVWRNAASTIIGSTVNPAVSLANSGLTNTLSTSTVNVTVTDNGPLNMVSNAASTGVSYSNAASSSATAGSYAFNSSLANVTATGQGADADLAANAQVANFEQLNFAWTSGGFAFGNTPTSTAAPTSSPASVTNAITFSQAIARGLTTTTSSIPLTVNVKDRFAVANAGAGVSNTGAITYANSAVSGANSGGAYAFNSSLANVNVNGTANDADLVANAVQPAFEQITGAWTSGGNPIGNTPSGTSAPTASPASFSNTITFAQAVAAGLTNTTASVPLSFSATDRAGATSADSTTLSYTNSAPVAASASSTNNLDYSNTFASLFTDADLAGNGVVGGFESLMFDLSLSNTFGTGFMSGMTAPTQTTSPTLGGTLTLPQLLTIFGALGTYTAYANVKDLAGAFHSLSFEVKVVPEPGSILVWGGLAAIAGVSQWRRRRKLQGAR